MDDATQLKEESVRQWTSEPAGAHLADSFGRGTAEFFAEVERTRYALYPWLREYLSDPAWAGREVLEIGVGLGTDHMQLRRAGARLIGVDLTPTSLEQTRRRFELVGEETDLRGADCEDLPFAGASFDGVYSFGVLHHTPDMQRAIDEVHRVVRPGGRVVVGLYNRFSYFHAWRLVRHAARGDWRRKSLAEMRAEFEFGEGTPVVRLTSRWELRRAFSAFDRVTIAGRHLPTNRLPAGLRPRTDELLRPVEDRFGWYWIVVARR